jgi:hypothetical protein
VVVLLHAPVQTQPLLMTQQQQQQEAQAQEQLRPLLMGYRWARESVPHDSN